MRHAILLLWHKEMEQLIRLLHLFDDDFSFYIHLDKKSYVSPKEYDQLSNMPQVKKVYQKYKIYWGGFNILKAELFLLQESLKVCTYDYIHFMSGQDYPIKSLKHIKDFFETNQGYEFIEYMSLPALQWEQGTFDRFIYFRLNNSMECRNPKRAWIADSIINFQKRIGYRRRVPNQFNHLYGGSNWLSITGECAKYIIANLRKHHAFYNRMKYTFAPDETYFHTVILNSTFKEKVQNRNLRYIRWMPNAPSPMTLNELHWSEIATSDCLFARKIEPKISGKLLSYIDQYILKRTNNERTIRLYLPQNYY